MELRMLKRRDRTQAKVNIGTKLKRGKAIPARITREEKENRKEGSNIRQESTIVPRQNRQTTGQEVSSLKNPFIMQNLGVVIIRGIQRSVRSLEKKVRNRQTPILRHSNIMILQKAVKPDTVLTRIATGKEIQTKRQERIIRKILRMRAAAHQPEIHPEIPRKDPIQQMRPLKEPIQQGVQRMITADGLVRINKRGSAFPRLPADKKRMAAQ